MFVPGTINPADIASRGCGPLKLEKEELWKHGPSFLITEEWPEQPDLIEDEAVRAEYVDLENELKKNYLSL